MRSLLKSAVGVVATFALGAAAQAQTFTPSDKDLGDLDHHSAYTWRIGGVDLTGLTITGATLEFDNIKNWNSGDNRLHMHLLDTARKGGVASFYDDNPNNGNVTD